MQPHKFYTLVQHPDQLKARDMAELELLVKEFPYFQAAHILLTLNGRMNDARIYQKTLGRTAVSVSSRTQLLHLVEKAEQVLYPRPENLGAETTESIEKTVEAIVSDPNEDLQILQAAELTVGPVANEEPTNVVSTINESDGGELAEEQKTDIAQLDQEIGKEISVASLAIDIEEVSALQSKITEEPESFGDWLNYLKKNNGQSYSEITTEVEKAKQKQREKEREKIDAYLEKTEDRKQKNRSIIDKIIEKNPGVIRQKEEQKFFAAEQKAKESLLDNEHLVTETLARIYALQGSVNKAIRAYEILSLKYPQKSAYFAGLIQKLKHNQ